MQSRMVFVNKWTLGTGMGLVLLLIWQMAAGRWVDSHFLASPLQILNAYRDNISAGTLFPSIFVSYGRILGGWAIGGILGAILGTIMARHLRAYHFFNPSLQFYRFIPSVALVPVLVIWLGVGEMIKLVIVASGALVLVVISTVEGVLRVADDRIRAAHSLGANERQIFWGVLLPSAAPAILKGFRGALGYSFMHIVGVEMLASQSGVGYMIWGSRIYQNVSEMIMWVITLGIMGLLADSFIRFLLRVFAYRFEWGDLKN